MDSNILVAVITSVTSAASTTGVAITAIILNNKRFEVMERRIESIETKLDMIIGKANDIDTRLAVLEDRAKRWSN